uniref:Nucleotide-diphospho-sugar transferase domain-containing protein n=1 Tax=Plectus sambesii TaxID=2011161 RepID=A0A914W1M9_9BILA
MRNHADSVSVEALMASDEWKELQSKLEGFSQAPAFILFNSFALPMTLNWLCNTADWPAVHQRLVLVTLDDKSRDIITALWPHIVVFHWPHVKQLQERFSAGDFSYQLIFLLRTNIIRAVLRTNRPIWMLQQDTFWRGNLFEMNLEQQYENADVLLDQMGYVDDGPRAGWTNGANWFIRPTEISKRLFDDIAWYQTNMYTQDTGVINLRCHSQSSLNCSFIPYK